MPTAPAMTSDPDVTIAIPTYNRAGSYLQDALRSALGQSHENIEVIVSDNCSTDDTAALVQSFRDPRLTYIRQDRNIGARNNMNFLLSRARGRYFHLFMDDDQIDDDFIECCAEAFHGRSDVGVVITGARVIDDDGRLLRQREARSGTRTGAELILEWYERKIQLFLCGTLFRTSVLRQQGGFEDMYNHFDDVAAEFKCAAAAGALCISSIKAGLREHSSSITRLASVAEWCDSSIALLELALSLAGPNRADVVRVGYQVTAERNYVLADALPTLSARWKGHITVLRRFQFRHWPPSEILKGLLSDSLARR